MKTSSQIKSKELENKEEDVSIVGFIVGFLRYIFERAIKP